MQNILVRILYALPICLLIFTHDYLTMSQKISLDITCHTWDLRPCRHIETVRHIPTTRDSQLHSKICTQQESQHKFSNIKSKLWLARCNSGARICRAQVNLRLRNMAHVLKYDTGGVTQPWHAQYCCQKKLVRNKTSALCTHICFHVALQNLPNNMNVYALQPD